MIAQPTNRTSSVLENITLNCKAEGFIVNYKWRRRNGTIRSANTNLPSLTIQQVVPSDADEYYCIASTEGGTVYSDYAILTVNGEIIVKFFYCVQNCTYCSSGTAIKFSSR